MKKALSDKLKSVLSISAEVKLMNLIALPVVKVRVNV